MNIIKFRRTVLTLGFILGTTGAALAQSPTQFISSNVKAGQPVPRACLAEAKVFQAKLALYPQRQGWTNVIACDQSAWQNAFNQRGRNVISVDNYLVDLSERRDVFNGADFAAPRIKAIESKSVVAVLPAAPTPNSPALLETMELSRR